MRIRSLLVSLFIFIFTFSYGKSKNTTPPDDTARRKTAVKSVYPIPPDNGKGLFYLQRTSNANTIVYDINIGIDGKPDEAEPVKAYWIRYADQGQKQDLNYVQRKFAYGLTTKALNNGSYDIRFVSYKKFPLTLMKSADGKYHIFALIAQKQVILNRIFVKIEGGSFWLPNVVYVELKGTDPVTGREILEHFKP